MSKQYDRLTILTRLQYFLRMHEYLIILTLHLSYFKQGQYKK